MIEAMRRNALHTWLAGSVLAVFLAVGTIGLAHAHSDEGIVAHDCATCQLVKSSKTILLVETVALAQPTALSAELRVIVMHAAAAEASSPGQRAPPA
jgi:hypothetical protein